MKNKDNRPIERIDLFTGTSEQFRYTLNSKDLKTFKAEIKDKLKISGNICSLKNEDLSNYPDGSTHFYYLENSIKNCFKKYKRPRKVKRKILVIIWRMK